MARHLPNPGLISQQVLCPGALAIAFARQPPVSAQKCDEDRATHPRPATKKWNAGSVRRRKNVPPTVQWDMMRSRCWAVVGRAGACGADGRPATLRVTRGPVPALAGAAAGFGSRAVLTGGRRKSCACDEKPRVISAAWARKPPDALQPLHPVSQAARMQFGFRTDTLDPAAEQQGGTGGRSRSTPRNHTAPRAVAGRAGGRVPGLSRS